MPKSKERYIVIEEVEVVERRRWLISAYSEEDAVLKFENFEVADIRWLGLETIRKDADKNRTLYAEEV